MIEIRHNVGLKFFLPKVWKEFNCTLLKKIYESCFTCIAEDMKICMFYNLHFVHNCFQLSMKDTCLMKIQADCNRHIVQ